MSHGIRGCETSVEVLDRTDHLVTCPTTGFEGIWSTLDPQTLTDLWNEHIAAHDAHDREVRAAEDYRIARASAWHIYRTTEPNDPRRNGIGVYLVGR